MAMKYKNSFKNKMLKYIEKMQGCIVLRSDVATLGDARQVSRGLKALVEDEELIKLGYGVYAKAVPSKNLEYINRPIIRAQAGFTGACIEVLKRLGVEWDLSQATKDYNEGRSQQVPARFTVRLKSRFRRKISDDGMSLRYEGMVYAK